MSTARAWLLSLACVAIFIAGAVSAAIQTQPQIVVHGLAEGIDLPLTADWVEVDANEPPPSVLLTGSAPPVHFAQIMYLRNKRLHAILKFAASENFLAGHDAYWLDAQMHAPNDSGANLPNILFYFFFPPPQSCLAESSNAYAGAGRAPAESGQPDLVVYLDCKFSPTLEDFYSSQISSGVILRNSEQNGLRAVGVIDEFYLAPMQEIDTSAMTFYVFEARALDGLRPDLVQHLGLPANLGGGVVDYFWAVGAKSPFPFPDEPQYRQATLVHLAYASVSVDDNDPEKTFTDLLHRVRVK
jgi:hypothetical protein